MPSAGAGGVDQVIAELAACQGGVVARGQLLALGITRGQIEHRIGGGRLHRVFRGVYAVGHPAISDHGRIRAALLAAGAAAVASHRTAAALHRLIAVMPHEVEVTVTRQGPRSRPGLTVHRTTRPLATTTVAGLLVTTPLRTLGDLKPTVTASAFDALCAEALVRRLVGPGQLETLAPDAAPTRSSLERRFRRLISRAGLPAPQVNRRDHHSTPDFCWPEHRVIAETDGWGAHQGRSRFESDRARDADRTGEGWTTLRFTARQVDTRPGWVIARLAATLARAATNPRRSA